MCAFEPCTLLVDNASREAGGMTLKLSEPFFDVDDSMSPRSAPDLAGLDPVGVGGPVELAADAGHVVGAVAVENR